MEAFQGMLTTNVVFTEIYKVLKNSTDIITAPTYFQSLYGLLMMGVNIAAILIIPIFIRNPMIGFRTIYYYVFSLLLQIRYRKFTYYSMGMGADYWSTKHEKIAKQCIAGSLESLKEAAAIDKFNYFRVCYIYKYELGKSSSNSGKLDWVFDFWIPRSINRGEQLEKLLRTKDNFVYTTLEKSNYNIISKPFISASYEKIGQVIQKLVNIRVKNWNIVVPAMLINGTPGLGKTFIYKYLYFLNYIKTVCIYHINCLSYEDFNDFITKLGDKSNPSNILIIDEIDKYFDLLCSKQDKDGHPIHHRVELLSKLMNFVDNNLAIKIFCSNNFDTLFRGNEVHFDALKTRFMSIDMKPYTTKDIEGFYKFINNNLVDTDCYVEEKKLEVILDKLKKNITEGLPRKLNQILISNGFDFEKSVDEINTCY